MARPSRTVFKYSTVVLVLTAVVAAWAINGMQERQDRLDRALIASIKAHYYAKAIAELKSGASANAIDRPEAPHSLNQLIVDLWSKLRGRHAAQATGSSALMLACTIETRSQSADHAIETRASGGADSALLRELLIRHANPNEIDLSRDLSILDSQVKEGYEENVVTLLNYGADPNRGVRDFPLHWAVVTHRERIAEILLQHGANVEQKGDNQTTVLQDAAWLGSQDPQMLQLLIDHHANVNAQDGIGMTPLMCTYLCRPAIIQFFLKNGADVLIKDNSGKTALDHFSEIPDSQDKKVIIRLLTEAMSRAGSRPDQKTVGSPHSR